MKLKKTLVTVLAACMAVGSLAGTAMAEPVPASQYEVADNSVTAVPVDNFGFSVLPDGRAMVDGMPIGELVVINPTTGALEFAGILTEMSTPYTGWMQYGDAWAYYNRGELQRHWQNIDGKWYYFNSYGIMVQNGVAWIEDRLYYFDESGVCDTTPGWKLVPDYFYVYENDIPTMVKPEAGFAWFYLNQNGYIQTGWNYIDGTWHMCDKQTGRMLCNEWYRGEGGYWYYFDEYTDMATGWMTIAEDYITNRTYFFNNSGVLQWGWLYNGGNWYYLNPKNAARVENSWAFIEDPSVGGYWYLFDEFGIMQTGWQAVAVEETPAFDYVDSNGVIRHQPASVKYQWYYLTSWGAMMKDVQYLNGNWYDFGDDGVLDSVWDGEKWIDAEYQASNYLVPGESMTQGVVPNVIEF